MVLVLALLAAVAMRYVNSVSESNAVAATNATLDVIETALLNYRNEFGRLPCPADLTQPESAAAFGTETDSLGDGNCTGANYINSQYMNGGCSGNSCHVGGLVHTDPDSSTPYGVGITGDSYAPAADPLFDANSVANVVEGAVPTKALKIADKYAYDAWGNKIFYVVDERTTNWSAFTTYLINDTTVGAIVIKKTYNDTLANAITYKGIYALVSAGKNGHGAYPRNVNGSAGTGRINAGSINTDELKNCHCTNNGVSTNYFDRIFVQKSKTIDSTQYNDNFDDIVRFKTRSQMASSAELK